MAPSPHPLDDVEFRDRDAIVKLQRAKLIRLGLRLAGHGDWRAHFHRAGMRPEDLAGPDGLASAPMLEKSDLRSLYPFPLLTVPVEQVARFCATSGTTGLPVMFGLSHRDIDELLPRQLPRIFAAAPIRPADPFYHGSGYG